MYLRSLVAPCAALSLTSNYQGKRRRSTEGAEGTNTGHENAEGMACVGVRLTAQLGDGGTSCLQPHLFGGGQDVFQPVPIAMFDWPAAGIVDAYLF